MISDTCYLSDSEICCIRRMRQDFDHIWPDNRLERFTSGPEFRAFKQLLKRAALELNAEELSLLQTSFEDAVIEALRYR